MNYQKVDAGLAALLAQTGGANAPPVDVFIHLERNLTADQVAVLERTGAGAPQPGRDIVTARLTPDAVGTLSDYPWVRFLRLSSRSRLI